MKRIRRVIEDIKIAMSVGAFVIIAIGVTMAILHINGIIG